jgi:hypothetical protein
MVLLTLTICWHNNQNSSYYTAVLLNSNQAPLWSRRQNYLCQGAIPPVGQALSGAVRREIKLSPAEQNVAKCRGSYRQNAAANLL